MAAENKSAPAKPALDEARIERVTRIFCAIADGPAYEHFINLAVEIEAKIVEAAG
jgi:hypothetical protein